MHAPNSKLKSNYIRAVGNQMSRPSSWRLHDIVVIGSKYSANVHPILLLLLLLLNSTTKWPLVFCINFFVRYFYCRFLATFAPEVKFQISSGEHKDFIKKCRFPWPGRALRQKSQIFYIIPILIKSHTNERGKKKLYARMLEWRKKES